MSGNSWRHPWKRIDALQLRETISETLADMEKLDPGILERIVNDKNSSKKTLRMRLANRRKFEQRLLKRLDGKLKIEMGARVS